MKQLSILARKRDLNLCCDLLPVRFNKGRINRGKNVFSLSASLRLLLVPVVDF